MGAFDDLIPGGPGPPTPGGVFDDLPLDPARARSEKLKGDILKVLPKAGPTDIAMDAATMRLTRPVAGLMNAFGGALNPGDTSFVERYQAGAGAEKDRIEQARKESGAAGTAADVIGGLTAGGPKPYRIVPPVPPPRPTMWGTVRQGAAQGAVEGAAENSESLGGAAWGATKGGATAGATSGVLHGLLSRFTGAGRRARAAADDAARPVPPEDLKNQARSLYNQLDNSGIAFSDQQTGALWPAVQNRLVSEGYNPRGSHAPLVGIVDDIQALSGGPATYGQLSNLRTRIATEARNADSNVRRMAGHLLTEVDRLVDRAPPALNVGGADIQTMWPQARRLWRSAALADDVGWIADKAERRAASTYSGQNTDNATRQNFRGVVDRVTKPGSYNPYNPEQMAILERIVRGDTAQNAMRSTGNFLSGPAAQTITGAAGMGGGILGLHTGGDAVSGALGTAAGLAAAAGTRRAGHTLRNMAADRGQAQVDELLRNITTGSSAPRVPQVSRDDLVQLLMQQQGAGAAGRLAAGEH